MAEETEREEELARALEEVAGQLEEAARDIQKITDIVNPGYFSAEAEAYRAAAQKASRLL